MQSSVISIRFLYIFISFYSANTEMVAGDIACCSSVNVFGNDRLQCFPSVALCTNNTAVDVIQTEERGLSAPSFPVTLHKREI